MFHKSSKQIVVGIFTALLLLTMPGYAVTNVKVSNYGAGVQIWFEVEDFDQRNPDTNAGFGLTDEPGAFGRSITQTSGTYGAYLLRYDFDISLAGGSGGTWYFWGRVINPNNRSSFMLVEGHPGDPVPSTLPVSGLVNGQRIFEDDIGSTWTWARANHAEAHTKTLRDGMNTMYVLSRETNGIMDVFMWTNDPAYVPTDAHYQNAKPPALGKALNPNPADGATDVPREVVLSWKPGKYAPAVNGHRVFLGTVFSDVNDATGGAAQDANSYAPPQRLGFETTYYWRVDEVNAPPTSTVHKGNVWSFTTEPIGYPINGARIIATASSTGQADFGPEKTIDGSGLDANDLHSVEPTDMWLSGSEPQGAWIQYELDKVYKLHQMWVWNGNQIFEGLFGFGLKGVAVEYSTNGTDWTALAGVPEFAKAPGAAGYAHDTTVDFGGAAAKYVRLTATSNWGGILPQYNLSEVRFFSIPVSAREPSPGTGATGVGLDVALAWRAGREASKHDLYLSADWNVALGGTVPVASLTQAGYGPVALDLGKTYFWRVDEANDVETPPLWQGDIWNFKTIKSLVVDDLESYNDIDPPDPQSYRIFETWDDGYTTPTTNGALVGYDPPQPSYAETVVVHGGKQTMPLFYNNSVGLSEASMTLSAQRDWTVRGIGELSLWFRGNAPGMVENPVGTYTMTAAGVDIWGTADEFRYLWKQLSGDGEITAKVESILWVPGSGDWTKAGVMIRGTLDPGSPNAFVALSSGAGNGATFQWRTGAGGSSSSSRTLTGISPPTSVKLVRQGNTFTGHVFLNGQWQQEGNSTTVTMSDPVYVGLALTSHSPGVTTKAVFSEVTITGAVTGQFTEQVIGAAAMPSNDAVPLYVAIANSNGPPAVVKYDNAAASQIDTWTQWRINLQEFAAQGVNLANVDKIFIGLGDKANPQPGGTGTLYVDDIELYPQPAPVPVAEVWLEAEAAGTLGASWRVYTDPLSSGGGHIGSQDGDGNENDVAPGAGWLASYSFTAPAGQYKILLRGQEAGSDSFWVRIPTAILQTHEDPDQPGIGWVRFNGMDAPSGWAWDEVHSDDHSQAVVTWILPTGDHTLEIGKREDGVLLDAILITNNLDQDQDTLPDAIPQP